MIVPSDRTILSLKEEQNCRCSWYQPWREMGIRVFFQIYRAIADLIVINIVEAFKDEYEQTIPMVYM